MNKNMKVRYLSLAGLFTALIFIATAYIHIPTGLGYTHAGDGFIFLISSMLPYPYAIAASATGCAAADIFTGMSIWAPATIIIKSLSVLCFTNKSEKIFCKRNIAALFLCAILNILGYSIYEALIISEKSFFNAVAVSLMQTPAYLIQTTIGATEFILIGKIVNKKSV